MPKRALHAGRIKERFPRHPPMISRCPVGVRGKPRPVFPLDGAVMRELLGPLPREEARQARAVRLAIEAAGGLEPASQDTGKAHSHLSRCSSPNHLNSLTIRDVEIIEAAGHGAPGHPHVTRHLCRRAGGIFVSLPEPCTDSQGLAAAACEIAAEMGDVAAAVRTAVADGHADRAERAAIRDQLEELDAASASLRLRLDQMDADEERANAQPQAP